LLSSFFHFFVSDIFVPSLFLSPTFSIKPYCISDTYESLTDSQEEDDDDLLEFILQYNKDMQDEGVVVCNHPLIV